MNLEQVARDTRALTVKMIANAKSGHPGGSLSMIEALVLLHCEEMQPQPYHPLAEGGDIFILSKGHGFPAQAALWAVLGWIPEAEAMSLRKLGGSIQGHPSRQHQKMSIVSSGSLGQGVACGVGFALAYKIQGVKRRVYVLCGEGCLNEGITLEACRIAAYYQLHNLCLLVDFNRKQSDRYSQLMVHPERELEALGFMTEPCLGHSFHAIRSMLNLAKQVHTRPMAIILHTVKGKGVPAWEADSDGMHGSVTLSEKDLQMALEAING
jgi:transketolase